MDVILGEFKSWIPLPNSKLKLPALKELQTEELPARNGNDLEIMDIGNLKVIRGVQGGILILPRISWSGGAKPEIDKVIALKGIEKLENLKSHK